MKPAIAFGRVKPIVMEVIGKDGLKIAEYVDEGDKPLPYYHLEESASL